MDGGTGTVTRLPAGPLALVEGTSVHKDLVIIPDDQPGVLARMGDALGDAGVNIEGLEAFTGQGKGIVHLLVDEPQKAMEALASAGFEVKAARDVVVLDIDDAPGQMAKACHRLGDAGVNIEQAYIASRSRLVVVCDDPAKAREVFGL